jgi:hypothetical protein
LRRLVTGCSWDVAGRISGAAETTLRRRRDERTATGVFAAGRGFVERAKRNVGHVRGCPLARHARLCGGTTRGTTGGTTGGAALFSDGASRLESSRIGTSCDDCAGAERSSAPNERQPATMPIALDASAAATINRSTKID